MPRAMRIRQGCLEAAEAKSSVLSALVLAYRDFPSGTSELKEKIERMISATTDDLYDEFIEGELTDAFKNVGNA